MHTMCTCTLRHQHICQLHYSMLYVILHCHLSPCGNHWCLFPIEQPDFVQEWASPADQVLAMRRAKGDRHATIAAMHKAVDSVSWDKLLACLGAATCFAVNGSMCIAHGQHCSYGVVCLACSAAVLSVCVTCLAAGM